MDIVAEVEKRLKVNFPEARVEIDFHDGKHMALEIESASFSGKNLIAQHQMVYAALNDLIKEGWLHALKIKTIIPKN